MKVKYVGKVDQITCDYNGKRFVFNKSNPISDIPVEVFRLVSRESSGVISEYLTPFEEAVKEPERITSVKFAEVEIKPEISKKIKETKKLGRKHG
jgi:hypothetical protein